MLLEYAVAFCLNLCKSLNNPVSTGLKSISLLISQRRTKCVYVIVLFPKINFNACELTSQTQHTV